MTYDEYADMLESGVGIRQRLLKFCDRLKKQLLKQVVLPHQPEKPAENIVRFSSAPREATSLADMWATNIGMHRVEIAMVENTIDDLEVLGAATHARDLERLRSFIVELKELLTKMENVPPPPEPPSNGGRRKRLAA